MSASYKLTDRMGVTVHSECTVIVSCMKDGRFILTPEIGPFTNNTWTCAIMGERQWTSQAVH